MRERPRVERLSGDCLPGAELAAKGYDHDAVTRTTAARGAEE